MRGGNILDRIEIDLRDAHHSRLKVFVDVFDNSLSRKWLQALDQVLERDLRLEKNYCFFGFANTDRNAELLCAEINRSIDHINRADLGYHIQDRFTPDDCLLPGPVGHGLPGKKLRQERFNQLHRYFEDLQGTSGDIRPYYHRADERTRWHIRQLNLLCHEFESWALSWRKRDYAPEWQRPSQLMCWLHAPRFLLEPADYDLFGIDTIARPLGGVFVGVNKAVGKHHWEVFHDEGRDSRIAELTTTTLKSQTEAAADFDIEWAQDPGEHPWMHQELAQFRQWLIDNGFDPDDPALTIGHPQIGQVDLDRSFGSRDYREIWQQIGRHLDVWSVKTSNSYREYDYRWSDNDYVDFMIGERHELAT